MLVLKAVRAFATSEHRLTAAALIRVGLGSVMIVFYALHVMQRAFIWGPNGTVDWVGWKALLPHDALSLFVYSGSAAYAETMFWLALAVSVAYTLGVLPTISSVLFYIMTWTMFDRNYATLDGGQNLLGLFALYLCFANTGARLSAYQVRLRIPARLARLRAIVHNTAMAACVMQIAVLYLFSGFYKVTGHKWQDGTALYYVMRTREFTLPGVSRLFYEHGMLITVMTYAAMGFLLVMPTLMWLPRAKPFLFAGAVAFHLGIAVFMGLPWFSATMIVADVVLFSDWQFEALRARAAALLKRAPRLLPAARYSTS